MSEKSTREAQQASITKHSIAAYASQRRRAWLLAGAVLDWSFRGRRREGIMWFCEFKVLFKLVMSGGERTR